MKALLGSVTHHSLDPEAGPSGKQYLRDKACIV